MEDNKIDGLEPIDYLFKRFEMNIDPIYFIENILRAHLPDSRRHLHKNQIEFIRAACNPQLRKVAAMMARQCFAKGTQLLTNNNKLIKVENIVIGTQLKTPNNKSAIVINTTQGVAQLYIVKEKENYDIPYIVTDNHNLVLTDGKKRIITTVKDYLLSSQNLKGIKCIIYGNNYKFTLEDIINIAYYLPNDINIYKEILNSILEIKYIFIQEFLKYHTLGINQQYIYYNTYLNNDILFILRRIFWSCGYSTKLINDICLFIKYNLQFDFTIEPYKIDEYYGFTLDSDDNLCVLSDNTIAHNSGKCFAKDTLIRLYNGEIKKVQDIVEKDILMGSDSKPRYINQLSQGIEKMVDIFTDINKFSVNMSHELVVYDDKENKQYIEVKDYIQQNKKMKMKIVPIEYNKEELEIEAYYAGYDHKFNNLLYTSIKTRQNILAGLIDSLSINYIQYGIQFYINKYLKDDIKELLQSLGYKIFIKEIKDNYIEFNIIGNFSNIPVKNKKGINLIYYNNSYIDFSIKEREEDEYFGFSLYGDNKEFLLADGTIVHNTESIACFTSYLISVFPQMRIGIFTPRINQAEVSIGRATVFFQMNEDRIPHKIVKLTKQKIELDNGSYMQAVSGSDQSNIEGKIVLSFHI